MSSVPIKCTVQALYPFKSNDPSSLTFEQGAIIDVLTKLESGWWDGWCNGARGWFPSNYVQVIEDYEIDTPVDTQELNNKPVLFQQEEQLDEYDQYNIVHRNGSTSTFTTKNSVPMRGGSKEYRLSLTGPDPNTFDEPTHLRQASLGSAVVGNSQRVNGLSDWTIQTTEDGTDCYYYNRVTGEMRTTDPNEDSDSEIGEGQVFHANGSIDDDDDDRSNDLADFRSDDGQSWADGNVFGQSDHSEKLPAPWQRSITSQGRVCYYNPVTSETTYDINAIDPATGHTIHIDSKRTGSAHDSDVRRSVLPRPLPRSPSRQVSGGKTSVIDSAEPLTWSRLSTHIALTIHNLNTAAKNHHKRLFVPYTAEIVNAIRFMLITSGTFDKESLHIRTNPALRGYHRAMMASMSKLILSSQLSTDNTDDAMAKMLSDCNDLLVAVRNFVSTCQDCGVTVEHMDPKILDEEPSDTQPATSPSYVLQSELVENLILYGKSMREPVAAVLKGIRRSVNQRSRASHATALFNQFRNIANHATQFLNIVQDISQGQSCSPIITEQLKADKQRLLDGVGQLFFQLQTMTDESAAMDSIIVAMEAGAKQVDLAIQGVCRSVSLLAKELANTPTPETNHSLQAPLSPTDNVMPREDQDDDEMLSATAEGFSVQGDSNTLDSSALTDMTSISAGKPPPAPTKAATSKRFSISKTTAVAPQNGHETADAQAQETPESSSRATLRKSKKPSNDETANAALAAITSPKPTVNDNVWYLQYDYNPSEIVLNSEGQVKGGTFSALVERLTLHDYLDMSFISTFLLTYRSFCTSIDLLNQLKIRYNLTPPEGLSEEDIEIWTEKKLKLVRLRVFNVLKNWLEFYYNDDDYVILDPLSEFMDTEIRPTLNFSVDQLERLIRMRKEEKSQGALKRMIPLSIKPPEPILPRNRKKFKLLDIDTLEMARQLTIMDFKLYSSILPVECLDKAWSRDANDENGNIAVNIRASIEYCNQVTSWVSDAILSQSDVRKRSIVIKYWVSVAEKCRSLNNFNTCMAILSAFDNSSVGRLRRTWEVVGARTKQVLAQIRKLMGANRNFTEYRAFIHSINPPCIPFLGIYLQDLTFIEDGNANFLKNSKDHINFAKRAKTAEVIREIQQYQSSLYHLDAVEEIQNFIKASLKSTRDEEQLYNESLKLEPREREDEKIARLLQESGFL